MGPLAAAVGLDAGGTVGLVAFFVVGLLGGAHCLGMCGPLVTVYADRMDGDDRGRLSWHELRQHGLFNAGRTVGYAAVGGLLGFLGGLLFDAGAVVSLGSMVRGSVGAAVGLAIVAVGFGYALRGSAHGGPSLPLVGAAFQRVHGVLVGYVDRLVDGPGVVGLGVVHAALPCPILYPAYLYAFAQGSAAMGALSLAAVGLGTFPTLFAFGTAIGGLDVGSRSRLHRALGAALVVAGLVPLSHGLATLGLPVPMVPLPMPESPV
jgi:sulfite exporter TauE/SafE